MNYNKVILAGRTVMDPKSSVTANGHTRVKCAIAINKRYTDSKGTLVDDAVFINIELYGAQCESFLKHVTKGVPIMVEGELRQWHDPESTEERPKPFTYVSVHRWQFTEPPKKDGAKPVPAPVKKEPAPVDAISADDIPF